MNRKLQIDHGDVVLVDLFEAKPFERQQEKWAEGTPIIVHLGAQELASQDASRASLIVMKVDTAASIKRVSKVKSAPMAGCDAATFAGMCKSVELALERGGSVCFLAELGIALPWFSQRGLPRYEQRDEVTGEEASAMLQFRDNVIGYRLLFDEVHWLERGLLETSLSAVADEFRPVVNRYMVAEYYFDSVDEDVSVLVRDKSERAVALAARKKLGTVFWIPIRSGMTSSEQGDALTSVIRSSLTYVSRRAADEPDWVRDQFMWPGENELRNRRSEASEILRETEELATEFARLRQILWARDEGLRSSVTYVLRRVGFEVDDDERFKEDFWIISGGEKQVIGEVKALNRNPGPSDLAHVVSHRKEAKLGDDFPSLFIVLPSANVPSVEKRRIEPNVCRRAKEDNVVIMRTLDLAHAAAGIISGTGGLSLSELRSLLQKGGGWLQIDEQGVKFHVD